jgi:hypothetical protein
MNDRKNVKYTDTDLALPHSVHHKPDTDRNGTETGDLRWEASIYELRHDLENNYYYYYY